VEINWGLLTISYKREKVLKLFLASIKRLRTDIGYFPCVVVGDEEHKELCEAYECHHITQVNHPATAKFNTGVDYLMSLQCRYVMITGSDDICSTQLMKTLVTAMESDYDLIGISSTYFYAADGVHKGNLRHLKTKDQILGIFRVVHRRLIEKVGGVLWNKEASWGMDGICMKNIQPHVKTWKIVEGDCFDVKSAESLNKFSFWLSKIQTQSPPEIFYSILSKEEKQILSEI
jgi:hypothetical protein